MARPKQNSVAKNSVTV